MSEFAGQREVMRVLVAVVESVENTLSESEAEALEVARLLLAEDR